MFAEKALFTHSNPSNIHLPVIGKSFRRRIRPPPTPLFSSRAAKAAHIAENVSALKAKYNDYTTWLKTSTRPNHEPVLTQELLKTSLCQMGVDSGNAEQLVSKCSWYVYQFQKDLKIDPEQQNQYLSLETTKQKEYKNKSKKTLIIKDSIENSTTTINSFDPDDSILSNSRNNPFALPSIHVSDLSTSSRFRRVDFDNEHIKNTISQPFSTHARSNSNRSRLKPISNQPSLPPIDFDLSSSSQRSLRRHGGHTRSILRKQTISSSTSSNTSTDISQRKYGHSRLLTPVSKEFDDTPLGTRSQRLFGGSECFAQIMNELEQQEQK